MKLQRTSHVPELLPHDVIVVSGQVVGRKLQSKSNLSSGKVGKSFLHFHISPSFLITCKHASNISLVDSQFFDATICAS